DRNVTEVQTCALPILCGDLAALCWGGPCAGEAVGGAGVVQDLGQVGEQLVGEVVGGDSLGLVVVLDVLGVGVLDVLEGVVLVGAGVVRQHGGCRLGRGVRGVGTPLGVGGRVRVGLCGLFRVGLTGAAGPHGLGRRTSGDGLDGVGYGPVLGGGAAVGEHTDDVSTGGLSDLH